MRNPDRASKSGKFFERTIEFAKDSLRKDVCAIRLCARRFSWILEARSGKIPQSAHMLTEKRWMGWANARSDRGVRIGGEICAHRAGVNFGLGYLYWKMRQYDAGSAIVEVNCLLTEERASSGYLGRRAEAGKSGEACHCSSAAFVLRRDIAVAPLDLGAILMQQKSIRKRLAGVAVAPKSSILAGRKCTTVWAGCIKRGAAGRCEEKFCESYNTAQEGRR